MPKSYSPPKNPSRQYLEDIAWIKAFVGCGWTGKRAIGAADAAIGITIILPQKKKRPN